MPANLAEAIIPYRVDVPLESLTLLYDQVLVEFLEPESMTPTGLYIPGTAKRSKLQRGRVVACGRGDKVTHTVCERCGEQMTAVDNPKLGIWTCFNEGCSSGSIMREPRHPMHVKPGDIVWFGIRPWADMKINGKTYGILHEEQHIVAVEEPDFFGGSK